MELKLLSKEDFRKGGDVMGKPTLADGDWTKVANSSGRLGESIRRVGMAS